MLILSNHSISIQQLPTFLEYIQPVNSDYPLIPSRRDHASYPLYILSSYTVGTNNQAPKQHGQLKLITDAEPSDWPYDPDEEKSFTSAEKQLLDKYKFGARWPTVRGAIDIFRCGLMHCVDKMTWKDRDTRLTYRAWNTVNICPPDRRLWDRKSTAYEINLAFLEQGQADVLARAEGHFDRLWARDGQFRKTTVNLTRSVLKYYGSVDDGYTNYEGLLPKEKLAKERRIILDDFDAQRDAMLKADARDFQISTEVATRAVRHSGFGYVPTMMTGSSGSGSSSKVSPGKTGTEKGKGEKREKSRDKYREQDQNLPIRTSRDRGSSRRTESPGQQRQESRSKAVEARPPAKKLDSSKTVEAKPPVKTSSSGGKRPAAQADGAVVPSSSRTGGSGGIFRHQG
ncbi:hypothetical protein BCON_0289g00120 [Botryotinia convoluta]|uniref:Uncharacterized protein n=1 Tax=Botryotinia convoluta TaxID=54673 RepID=A0A4Z1HDT6_9HELO|nr:hypothetical protein BCON_0289g00120 [Botryotinia convoluta]